MKARPSLTIRTRLCLAFLLVVGLGFFGLLRWIVGDLRPRYLETMEESMVDIATFVSSLLSEQVRDGTVDVAPLRAAVENARGRRFEAQIYDVTKTRFGMRIYVTDHRGKVLFDSDGGRDEGADYSRWNDVRRTLDGRYGARASPSDPDDPTTTSLYVASPILHEGQTVGVVTVCKPTRSVRKFLGLAKRKILLVGTLAALGVVLLGWIVSARITGPIRRLTRYANAVRDGRRETLPPLGHSEIGQLGAAFEEMRDALEGKGYIEGYVTGLTHEMKSPLSAIQGAAELLEDESMPEEDRRRFLQNVRTESARIRDLVDRLLQLSSVEKRKSLRDVEPIDLEDMIDEIASSLEPVLSARRVRIDRIGETEVPSVTVPSVTGERFLVRQALANLLQNAVDFSPEGGRIEVELGREGESVEIRIRDHGTGVPSYALPRVFERFYSLRRPEGGLKGSGLGLTFAREVATLHGGEVRLENAAGGGAVATLRFPISGSRLHAEFTPISPSVRDRFTAVR